MTLDAQTKAMLDAMATSGAPPLHELEIDAARSLLADLSRTDDATKTPVADIKDQEIPGPHGSIPIRIYWPNGVAKTDLPIAVYFHGGGFALGDIETHDQICRYLATNGQSIVISVHYRLAPENPFPMGLDDCFAAVQWATNEAERLGGNANRICVAGDSAGGNLSIGCCLMAKAAGAPLITHQILIYPVTDLNPDLDTASRRQFGNGDFFLSKADTVWIKGMYLKEAGDIDNPHASPARLSSSDLSGLPPALVITAGFDILRDEGKQFADDLIAAGTPAMYKCFDGTIHGFISFSEQLDAGKEGLACIAQYMTEQL